jgi:predicted DNA-binding protein (MmcQ/YjbR family)
MSRYFQESIFKEGTRVWQSTNEIRDLIAAYVQAHQPLDTAAINRKNFTLVPNLCAHYYGAGQPTTTQPGTSAPVAAGTGANMPARQPNTSGDAPMPVGLVLLAGAALIAGAALRRRMQAEVERNRSVCERQITRISRAARVVRTASRMAPRNVTMTWSPDYRGVSYDASHVRRSGFSMERLLVDGTIVVPREHAQEYALAFPGAYAEHPWGQTGIKVKRKMFLFVNGAIAPQDSVSLSVKLPQSGADVLQLPLAEPMGYGLGKHGWVTLLIMRDDQLPLPLLEAWIDESYQAVAPKRLLVERAALRQSDHNRDEQLP